MVAPLGLEPEQVCPLVVSVLRQAHIAHRIIRGVLVGNVTQAGHRVGMVGITISIGTRCAAGDAIQAVIAVGLEIGPAPLAPAKSHGAPDDPARNRPDRGQAGTRLTEWPISARPPSPWPAASSCSPAPASCRPLVLPRPRGLEQPAFDFETLGSELPDKDCSFHSTRPVSCINEASKSQHRNDRCFPSFSLT